MDNLDLIDKNMELNTNDLSLDDIIDPETSEIIEEVPAYAEVDTSISDSTSTIVSDTPEEECTSLTVVKPNSLWVAQTMFKKSIKISIKSFLISLSLGFLNLFF